MININPTITLFVWLFGGLFSGLAFAGSPELLVGSIDGRQVSGLEVISAINRQIVLGTDGWIHDFDPRVTKADLRVEPGEFKPLDSMQMRAELYAEFGRDFEIVATRHYLVVQPQGSKGKWPQIFEQLHRTFNTYFSTRGVKVRSGNFPMVAIVMPSEASMQQYLRSLGVNVSGVLGVYDRASNRVVMYDHGGQSGGVAATICHEAAHQSAFNTGVHSRFAETPHWLVEGVGCLFQSPAMIEGRRNGPRSERIDPGLMYAYQSSYSAAPEKLAADLEQLVANDAGFKNRASIEDAYTAAWAMTFYLSEREPAVFSELVKCYAARRPLEPYTTDQRASDFLRIVGVGPGTIGHRVAKFFQQLN